MAELVRPKAKKKTKSKASRQSRNSSTSQVDLGPKLEEDGEHTEIQSQAIPSAPATVAGENTCFDTSQDSQTEMSRQIQDPGGTQDQHEPVATTPASSAAKEDFVGDESIAKPKGDACLDTRIAPNTENAKALPEGNEVGRHPTSDSQQGEGEGVSNFSAPKQSDCERTAEPATCQGNTTTSEAGKSDNTVSISLSQWTAMGEAVAVLKDQVPVAASCPTDEQLFTPVPQVEHPQTEVYNTVQQQQRHLYPKLESGSQTKDQSLVLQPFTEEQLRTLYYNYELEQHEQIVDSFLKEINQDKHEFYELVLNYYRARNHLASSEHDIEILQKDCHHYEELVWEMKEETMAVQGQCVDKSKVTTEVTFTVAQFSDESCQSIARKLKEIRGHIHDQLSLHAYEAQLSKLQVESYLYHLYQRNPALAAIPHNAPVRAWLAHQRDASVTQQVAQLKICISVLFMFQRKPAKDAAFLQETRKWLEKLVATLLRVAALDDHLYLMNQILRCPSGVGKWASAFVQLLPPPSTMGGVPTSWGNPILDHFIAVLAHLLLPVRSREELLYQMKVTMTPSCDGADKNPWILVDSDGEEDEDPVNSWHYLQENDLVALLQQFPLDTVFHYVLLMDSETDGAGGYDVQRTSEAGMLKLYAFATCLVRLLSRGLQHFSISRYRQLNKRLGKIIRHVIYYVSDHWENYQKVFPNLPTATRQRLQLEFDMTFQRAVISILSAQRLGSWQFLADLPFQCLSSDMMWRLVWVMQLGCDAGSEEYSGVDPETVVKLSIDKCKADLADLDNQTMFEEKLMGMPTSEAIFLLTTFSNMAQSRPNSETDFIQAISSEIYQIAYIKSHTRELCSKQGRELLASICLCHPFLLSDLLHATRQTMQQIGIVSLYLYKELPLHVWQPAQADLECLREWLLNKGPYAVENQLARLIIETMNWGYDAQAQGLFLDVSIHRQMAVLLVETYTTHLTGKMVGGLVTEGFKQMASLVRSQQTEEQALANWAWEVAQRLCLHANMQPRPVMTSPTFGPSAGCPEDIPDLTSDLQYQPIITATQKDFALAGYLALVMSKYSHNVADFCSEGLTLLASLASKSHYVPTIRALNYTTPLFYKNVQYLTSNELFYKILQCLHYVDNSKKPYFYAEFPGPVLKLFAGMIQSQIQVAAVPGGVGGSTVVNFWLNVLTKVDCWHTDRNLLYVVDKLTESSFRIQGAFDAVHQFYLQLHKDHMKRGKEDGGLFTSLVAWLSSGVSSPSMIEAQHCGDFSWYAYMVLLVEAQEEEDSQLWTMLQGAMFAVRDRSVEEALRVSASQLKLEPPPSCSRLAIYRWAHQALNMDMQHPLLPLIWQRFFLLYLGRITQEPGLPQRGSVGEKFFETTSNLSLMKKMKKRLMLTAESFSALASKASNDTGSDAEDEEEDEDASLLDPSNQGSKRTFYLSLVRFYQTLSFWLDEPRLHDPNLYLPALPPQYEPDRLLTLFQNQKAPWFEFVNWESVDEELRLLCTDWSTQISHDGSHDSSTLKTDEQKQTATERIFSRLKRAFHPKAPPQISSFRAPVPDVSPALLCDQKNLLHTLRSDFTLLAEFAKSYAVQVSRHVDLDCSFVELFPALYNNEMDEQTVTAECKSTFNITHRCKGAAVITARYDAAKRDEIVLRKIEENRAQYKQLIIECLLPPPQTVCSAAVHVENVITDLIKFAHSTQSPLDRKKVVQVGTALFYYVATFVSEETKYFFPTCQFFSSCIEVLGQEFIRNNPTQSQPLLQTILQTPSLVGLLSPNFSPNAAPSELFVSMYEDMLPVPASIGIEVAFTLLTKFDIELWLKGQPSRSQRSALLELIGDALCRCGKEPDHTIRVIFQVYRVHLQHVLKFRFPDHYGDMLKLLLKGCSEGVLCPQIWNDFLYILGCDAPTTPELESGTPATHHTVSNPTTSEQVHEQLSYSHMKESADLMSDYFTKLRTSSQDMMNFGLYPKWKDYVPPLAKYLSFLATRMVVTRVTMTQAGQSDPEAAVDAMWKQISAMFSPWIQPLTSGGQVLSPWIQNDCPAATTLLTAWLECVQCLQLQFEGMLPVLCRNAFSLLWPDYVHTIARIEVPKHVFSAYHNRLVTLPWNKFYPDIQAVELMVKLFEPVHPRSATEFLGNIFPTMDWADIVHYYTSQEIPEIVARLHVCLFTLMVQLGREKVILENTALPQLLVKAESFDWGHVTSVQYEQVTTWFLDHYDPKCVLAERTARVALVLNLLKTVSGFILEADRVSSFHPETPAKRCLYIKCMVQLVSKCSHLKEVDANAFHLVLANLLTGIETVVGTIPDLMCQQQEALQLCIAFLGVLNQCNTQGCTVATLIQTIKDWIESSCTSVLLLPLLAAACRALASMAHMVQVVEACMDAYFTNDVSMLEMGGWVSLLAAMKVPELSLQLFLDEALAQGCYLTLFAYLLQLLPMSRSIGDEKMKLDQIVEWTCKAKPNAQNEAKLLLWWGKLIDLVLRQVAFGGSSQLVIASLKKFVPALVTLGEDKTTTGLLGAIGLGKRSQLSLRFRVITRSLAAYLSAQVPGDNLLRTQLGAPGAISLQAATARRPSTSAGGMVLPSQHAVHCLVHLDGLRTNKQYLLFKEHVDFVVEYVTKPEHSLQDAPEFLHKLTSSMFPDLGYLALLRLSPQSPGSS